MAEVLCCIAMYLLCLFWFEWFKCAKLCTKEIELKFAKKPLGFKYARTWAEYWAERWTQCPSSWSSCFTSWWFRFQARGLWLLASEIGWAWLCDVLYVVFVWQISQLGMSFKIQGRFPEFLMRVVWRRLVFLWKKPNCIWMLVRFQSQILSLWWLSDDFRIFENSCGGRALTARCTHQQRPK